MMQQVRRGRISGIDKKYPLLIPSRIIQKAKGELKSTAGTKYSISSLRLKLSLTAHFANNYFCLFANCTMQKSPDTLLLCLKI